MAPAPEVSSPDRLQGPKPGEDDAEEYMHPYVQGVFGVLYTVTKEKGIESWWFAAFRYSLDFLQLFLLVVNPSYGWVIADNGIWRAVSAIGLNWVVSDIGYTLYLALFYIMVFALAMVVVLCVWVAYSFSNNNFSHVWPIKFLRWYTNIFFKVLEIASMGLLLIVLDCQYFAPAGDPSQKFHNQEFPDVVCFAGMHMVHAAVAIISLIMFVVMDTVMQMAEMELNPLARNLLAIGHTKVEIQSFLLKVLMTFSCSFLNNSKYLPITYLACATLLVWLQISLLPNLFAWINHVRAAVVVVVWYASVLLMAITFYPTSDPVANKYAREDITLALWVGMVPVAVLGAMASWARTYYFYSIVLPRFKETYTGAKSNRVIFHVTDAREIEILSRCCRVWVEDDMVDQEAVALAETVIKYGIATLGPKSAYMIILYSSFLIDVQTSYQSGYSQLQAAKKADPSILESFAIFAREQQHAQQSSGAGGALDHRGPAVNLVSFVEYKKNYRLAINAHREALQALRQFWTHLMQPDASLSALTKAVQRIEKAVTAAEKVYRTVLLRHSTNVRILRLYARFLEDVKQDPWSAAKWCTEADRHELAEEDAKNTNIFTELGIDPGTAEAEGLGDLFGLLEADGGLGAHANRAVIVINAQCIVQLANPAVCKMFGYASNSEIKGRNINMIIPQPFAEQHNQAVRNYVLTGKETVVGHTTSFVALAKHKVVFPITLQVSKISGIGEDMLFMGIIEAVPPEPNTATAWVMMGSECVVSVDSGFTNYFGFRADELLSAPMDKWLVDTNDVARVFSKLRSEVMKPDLGQQRTGRKVQSITLSSSDKTAQLMSASSTKGSNVVETLVRHRYLDAVSAQLTIKSSGHGMHRFFAIQLTVPAGTGHIMVTDSSGHVLHASNSFASALGLTPESLIAETGAGGFQTLLPQPFASLHADYLSTVGGPRVTVPPWSCRSGLSMMLNAVNTTGPPELKPFCMALTERANDKGDTVHIASLMETNMDQALGERRVRLVLDQDGKVLEVLSGERRVFGFSCKKLKGMVLGDFVDAFQGHYAEKSPKPIKASASKATLHTEGLDDPDMDGLAPPSSTERQVGPRGPHAQRMANPDQDAQVSKQASPQMRKALLVMATRAKDAPLTSWRVGVLPVSSAHQASLAKQMESTGIGAAAQQVPAIMALRVVEVADKEEALPPATMLSTRLQRRSSTARLLDHEQEAQRIDILLNLSPTGIVYVMDLWRAETCSAVLELDSNGVISHGTNFPLHPLGILLGAGEGQMIGQHIGRFLNLPSGVQASAFMNGELGSVVTSPAEEAAASIVRMRSNLKMSMSRRATRVAGPVSIMTVKHMTVRVIMARHDPKSQDESVLELSVQAVRKLATQGKTGGIYLIMRPVQPTCAREDFVDFLLLQREAELLAAREASEAEAERRARLLEACERPLTMARQATLRKQADSGGGNFGTAASVKPRAVMMMAEGGSAKPSISRAASRGSLFAAAPDRTAQPAPPPLPQESQPSPRSMVTGASQKRTMRMGSAVMDQPSVNERVQKWVLSGDLECGDEEGSDAGGKASQQPTPTEGAQQHHIVEADKNASGAQRQKSGSMASYATSYRNIEPGASSLKRVKDNDGDGDDDWMDDNADSDDGKTAGADEDNDDQRSMMHDKAADKNAQEDSCSEPSQLGEGANAAANETQTADYRRGHRFKKLLRLLGNAKVQARMQRFRWHSYGLVVGIVIIHLGLFILQHELLTDQKEGITNMYSVGAACRVVGETTHYMQEMEILHTKRGLASLPGLTNSTDMANVLKVLDQHISSLQELHAGVYMGFNKRRTLPSEFGLSSMWNDKVLPITIYSDDYGSLTSRTMNTSLWEAGNFFLALVDEVKQNHATFVAKNQYFWNWSAVQNVVTSGMDVVVPAYYLTMEGFLQLVIQQAKEINRAQLIILILEGAIMPLASFIYMWILAMQVTALRFNMYVVFILVPMGLIRQLASKAIVLGDEDDENQDDVADNLAKAAQIAPATETEANQLPWVGGDPSIKLNMPTISDQPYKPKEGPGRFAWWDTLVGGFRQWRTWISPPVARVSNRRRLSSSYEFAIWMAWPAAIWAIVNLALNIVAFNSLAGVDVRVAQLSIVNFVKAKYQSAFFNGMEVAILDDPWLKAQARAALNASAASFKQEYDAMMHGGRSVNSTAPRFSFTNEGVASVDEKGANLLFRTHSCMRLDQSTCMGEDDPYYEWVSNGLDRALTQFQLTLNGMLDLPAGSPLPRFNSTQMEILWKLKPDLEGGLILLSDTFRDSVLAVYEVASMLHIVNLVITMVFGFLLYWLMLRPVVVEAHSEARRVSELLSQLPPEIAVEQLVRKALQLHHGGANADEEEDQSTGGAVSSRYQDGNMTHRSSMSGL